MRVLCRPSLAQNSMNPYNSPKMRFDAVQYLRAIAALMVVVHHARNPSEGLFNPLVNYSGFAWGVDIFFVISGFIMYEIARHEAPINFMARRLIRVAPLYWGATIALFIAKTKLDPSLIDIELVAHIVKSLAFVPHYNLAIHGNISPYLVPGWTLNYEMLFYIVFFVGLLTKRLVAVLFGFMIMLFIVGQIGSFKNPIFITYTNPIIIEFLLGVIIAMMNDKGLVRMSMRWLLPAGLACLMSLSLFEEEFPTLGLRMLFTSAIVLGAVAMGSTAPQSKVWNILGDASYSIYLTHTFISLWLAKSILNMMPFTGLIQFFVWIFISILTSAGIGILVYIYFERPILKFLQSKWRFNIAG
jgi:exopolysaccharide production protein ExoZ